MAEECIALGCREPVRGVDLLLCPTHAAAWRDGVCDFRRPDGTVCGRRADRHHTCPDHGVVSCSTCQGQGEIARNGIFTLEGASREALRAVDAALIKAYPHSMTRVFQDGGRWYDAAVMAPRSASTPLVENCRWCRDGYRSGAACRQHPDLLALGVR